MSIENVKRAIVTAQSSGEKIRIGGAVSESILLDIETRLDVSFPSDYKFFVTTYGNISFLGMEIYGVVNENPLGDGPPNVLFMTKSNKSEFSLKHGYIVIHATGYGPLFILDTKANLTRSKAIFGWRASGKIDFELPEYSSFGEFLLSEITGIIEAE